MVVVMIQMTMHTMPPPPQMKSMSPLQMKMMMRVSSVVQRGAGVARSAGRFMVSRQALVLAILILLLAVLLRYLGVM